MQGFAIEHGRDDAARPAVTTVIPTYRRPQLLRRAITSALQQEGVDVRVAVFDNCSGDETGEVVATLAQQYPQVRYHCHANNIGAIANFDYGVRSVDTPFFSILSDDDYLLPGFYRRAIDGLSAHPDAMFWAGITLNVDERGIIWDARVGRWAREGMFLPPEGAMAMMGGMAPTWTGVLFRREVLALAGFTDREAVGPGDLDYMLRLGARFPFLVEKHPAAVFMLNSDAFSTTQPLSAFWPGWLRMLDNMERLPGLDPVDREKLLTALHADARRMLFRRGINALANKRHDYARDAATALSKHYAQYLRARLVRGLAAGCERIPGMQSVFSTSYRALERRIVASRSQLQRDYAHLLRIE